MIFNTHKTRACYVIKYVIDRVVCRIVNILTSCHRNCPFSFFVHLPDGKAFQALFCHRMANVSLYYIELKENFPLKQKQTCQHPRGEYSWEFLVRVCRPVLQTLTLFQTKKCNFPHPFSDKTSKIHTHFQTWLFRQKLCYHYLD